MGPTEWGWCCLSIGYNCEGANRRVHGAYAPKVGYSDGDKVMPLEPVDQLLCIILLSQRAVAAKQLRG